MEKNQALEFIEKNKINLDQYDSVIVTSDNAVYMNSELDPIAAHCRENGKTYFVVKSEVKNPLKEENKQEEKSPEPTELETPNAEAKEEKPKADPKPKAPKKQGKK